MDETVITSLLFDVVQFVTLVTEGLRDVHWTFSCHGRLEEAHKHLGCSDFIGKSIKLIRKGRSFSISLPCCDDLLFFLFLYRGLRHSSKFY